MFGRFYNNVCENNPAGFVSTDFGFFVFFGLFFDMAASSLQKFSIV